MRRKSKNRKEKLKNNKRKRKMSSSAAKKRRRQRQSDPDALLSRNSNVCSRSSVAGMRSSSASRRKKAIARKLSVWSGNNSKNRKDKSGRKPSSFSAATEPRRNGCAVFGSTVTYPLHQAAELADARIVEMLLKEGASPMMKNGSKLTAAQVAQKMNKGGSHDGVLQALKTAAAGGA